MLYSLHKDEISKAGTILADAFQHDPLWNKILEGESNIKRKYQACFETPIRYCHKFGETLASSKNLEGIAGWFPNTAPEMGFWAMIRSGAIFPGIRMGAKVGIKMGSIFKPMLKDRLDFMAGRSYFYLMVVGVASEFQGQGFGGLIIRELIDKCEKSGNHLYIETETQENVEFYKRYGFKVIKEITLPIVNLPMWEMIREITK